MPGVRPSGGRSALPRMQNGDRFNRIEFERRYRETDDARKIELIEGRVYVAPPTSQDEHSGPHFDLSGLLMLYRAATPGVEGGLDGTVRLDLDNEPRPDNFLFLIWGDGRSAKVDADGFVSGAPEFIAEVSASSANYDLHDKLEAYRRNGVREYMVVRTHDRAIDYFVLTEGRYERMQPVDGAYRSRVFPGLWVNVDATLARDAAAMVQTLQLGLASPEHQAFVQQLARHKPG